MENADSKTGLASFEDNYENSRICYGKVEMLITILDFKI